MDDFLKYPPQGVWATDCWSRSGVAHRWEILGVYPAGSENEVRLKTLCGKISAWDELQPESKLFGRCAKCLSAMRKEPPGTTPATHHEEPHER